MHITCKLTLEDVKPLISNTLRNRLALDHYNDSLDIQIEVPKDPTYQPQHLSAYKELRDTNKIYLIKMCREFAASGLVKADYVNLSDAKTWVDKYIA